MQVESWWYDNTDDSDFFTQTADYVKSVAYNLPEERTLTTQDYICFVAMSIN